MSILGESGGCSFGSLSTIVDNNTVQRSEEILRSLLPLPSPAVAEEGDGGGFRDDVQISQLPKHIRPLQHSLSNPIMHSLGQHLQLLFIGIERIGKPMDQCIAGIVAVIQPSVLNTTQIREANIDLLSQVSQTSALGVPKLTNTLAKRHPLLALHRRLLIAARA